MKKRLKRVLAYVLAGALMLQYAWGYADTSVVNAAEEKPVFKEGIDTNLVAGKEIPTSVQTGIFDLGERIEVTSDNPTWYYSGEITYTDVTSWTGAAEFIFAEGTYNNEKKVLKVVARETGSDTQLVVWAGTATGAEGDALVANGYTALRLAKETKYDFVVRYTAGKVTLWMDGGNQSLFWSYDMSTQVSNVTPKFGMVKRSNDGSISNIKIWGDFKLAPTRGDKENLATSYIPAAGLPVTSNITLPFEPNAQGENPTWYYSTKVRLDAIGNYQGFGFVFGQGSYTTSDGTYNDKNLAVQVRQADTSDNFQILVWGEKIDGQLFFNKSQLPITLAADKEYTCTVQYGQGKISVWIDQTCICADYEIPGLTNIVPKFGILTGGTSGTVTDLQIWGDFELAPTRGDKENLATSYIPAAGLPVTSDTILPFELKAQGENPTWYYSTKVRLNTIGNYQGFGFVFGQGSYTTSDGTYNDKNLAVQVRQADTSDNFQILVWGENNDGKLIDGNLFLNKDQLPITLAVDKEYTCTVQYGQGKISVWIDQTCICADFEIPGLTNIVPKFGILTGGTSGTVTDLQIWGDLAVMKATRPEGVANFAEDAGDITSFSSTQGVKQYYNNERIHITGDSWYSSGEFTYTGLSNWSGLSIIFGEGTYAYTRDESSKTGAVVGVRDLSVSLRNTNDGQVQKLIWAGAQQDLAVTAGSVPGLAKLVEGKKYQWTIEVVEGKLTFYFGNLLIWDDVDLASNGISNLKPKFGYERKGTSGTISNVEIWDGNAVAMPMFTSSDVNQALLEEVKLAESTDTLEYKGLTYGGGVWYYSAIVTDLNKSGLLVGKVGENTVTISVNNDNKVQLISNGTPLGVSESVVSPADSYTYKVRVDAGMISVWINDVLYIKECSVEGFSSGAGVVGTGVATVSDIKLWGDVTRTDDILYQKFEEISPYRANNNYTAPKAVGYVFAGWYKEASASLANAVAETTTSGAAYAKFVPEAVLSIKAQVNANVTYASTSPTRIRFVTTVDSTDYRRIVFDVTINGVTKMLEENSVGDAIKVRTGEDEFTHTPQEFHAKSKYFSTVSIKNMPVAWFNKSIQVVPNWITFDGTKVAGVGRDIAVNDNTNMRVREATLGNGLNGSKLFQLAYLGGQDVMLSYVIEAKETDTESKVIVIDGGTERDAAYLSWVLKTKYNNHVDAWFITHAHSDHYGALLQLINDNKINVEGGIQVDKLYYNLPDSYTFKTTEDGYDLAHTIVKSSALTGKVVDLGTDGAATKYVFGDVTIDVLSNCDEYWGTGGYTGSDQNNASIVYMATFGNATDAEKVLFLGDLRYEAEGYVIKQMRASGVDYTNAVVSMAHHGNAGVTLAFYDELSPKACLWTVADRMWKDEEHYDSARTYRYLLSKGVTNHYVSAYGNYEFR